MERIALEFDVDASPVGNLNAISVALGDVVSPGTLASATDENVLAFTAAVEALGRQVDALRISCASELSERSRSSLGSESLAAQKGCRNAAELLTRVTRISGASARTRLKLGADTRAQVSLAGVEFPARFPRVAAALEAGDLGVDAVEAILAGLAPIVDRVAIDEVAAAEAELVAAATGSHTDDVPCPADEIRVQAQVWKSVLDPDGLEPSE